MRNYLICCIISLFTLNATSQVAATFQGGIGVGSVDANLWVPLMGPIAEVSLDVAPVTGSYPWKQLPFSAGIDVSLLYAKSIGHERYDRAVAGRYISGSMYLGWNYKNWSAQVGGVVTTSALKGSGPFFDPNVDDPIGVKLQVRYRFTPNLVVQASATRHNCDLDGFVSEYSRHDCTYIYSLLIKYQVGRK